MANALITERKQPRTNGLAPATVPAEPFVRAPYLKTLALIRGKQIHPREILKCYNPRQRVVVKAAMNEASGTQGGYAVPQELLPTLMRSLAEESIFRRWATVLPMSTRETFAPVPTMTDVQAAGGTTPFFGGLKFTWGQSEGATVNDAQLDSGKAWQQVALTAWDLIGLVTLSNQLVMDMGPEADLAWMKLFGRAVAWYEDYAFFQGKGAGSQMPLGIVNSPGAASVTRAQAGAHISQTDLATMTGDMIPFGWGHAIWCCSPTALAQLQTATGFMPNQIPVFPPSIDGHGPIFPGVSGLAGTLLTRPMFVTEKLPACGTKGDLVFFDPTAYVIGDRQETLIDASPQVLFSTNQTVFRIWRRVDGKPMVPAVSTLQDGTTTASPIVLLNSNPAV